jgi:cobalt/nickel transport system permease protein
VTDFFTTLKFLIDSWTVSGRGEERRAASYTFVDSVTPLRYDEEVSLPICSLFGSRRAATLFLKDRDEAGEMHIPDGYLGPQTYGVMYGAMVPLWALASRIVRRTLQQRHVPFMALGAAFVFVIMMFNIPIPGGSTGHAVGGVLVAILIGPWAALIAISIALVIQSFLFGDGGVTAIAANCFNMAFIMPMTGYWAYRLIGGRAPATSRRRWIGAAIGGYIGLNVAAVTTAVMFGLQPLLARGADGRPLYFPYPLEVAIPVMAVQHLLLFGIIEAVITALLVIYFQRTDPSLLEIGEGKR